MWKMIRKLFVLLAVIGMVAAAVVLMVNNSSLAGFDPRAGTSTAGFQPPSGEPPAGFQPDQETGENPPAFKGKRPEREGGSSFAAMEILKNLGIIAVISVVIILLETSINWIKDKRKTSATPF